MNQRERTWLVGTFCAAVVLASIVAFVVMVARSVRLPNP